MFFFFRTRLHLPLAVIRFEFNVGWAFYYQFWYTLPKTNSKRPLKIGRTCPKRKRSSSNPYFSGVFAVSLRDGNSWNSWWISFVGGGNSNVFYFHPDCWGNDPIWCAYVSKGLVQPPSRWEKPWLCRVYEGLDYPVMWGLFHKSWHNDPYIIY